MDDFQIELFSTFDDPYPFKREPKDKNSLLIYPVIMREYFLFNLFVSVLTIDKNIIADVETIQMSYLEYLITADENDFLSNLYGLLSLVLRKDNLKLKWGLEKKKKPILMIDNVEYNHKDFDRIKTVICEQNLIDLPDETISSKLKQKLEEARRFRERLGKKKNISLEDSMVALSIATGIPLGKVYNMTIRKFRKALERVDHKLHYEIYLSASMSGLVEFKDKSVIKHWLSDLSRDPLSELIPYDRFEGNVSGAVQNN